MRRGCGCLIRTRRFRSACRSVRGGNFSEYYSDLDIILDDQLWKPSVVEGARGLYNWGPPPPPSFIHPEDLAALMTGSHAPKA